MKITKLVIKNLFGITEINLDGSNKEISGDNGTGKTSIIDTIRYALKNSSSRDYIIRNGEKEGEVIIETNTGLMIHRKSRTDKSDYKSVKRDGKEVQSPEAFLRDIFTELQLNPVEFISMPKQEQNRIILDMIEFEWNMDWIKKQFGEIPPDPNINWDQNILAVLFDIQKEDGFYYQKRQDINRDIRNKRAFIEEIGASLPKGYRGEEWKQTNLASLYEKIEKLRHINDRIEKARNVIATQQNKIRSFEADKEIAVTAIEKSYSKEKSDAQNRILELQSEVGRLQDRLAVIDREKTDKITVEEEKYRANVAEFEASVKEYEDVANQEPQDIEPLQKEAKHVEDMKSHINEFDRMKSLETEVEDLEQKSEDLTTKIEKARSLPGEILETATIPIKNLTVKDGIPLINGLPISNLSEGEKLDLCVDVAVNNKQGLDILLLDGVETLSTKNRETLYAKLKEAGVQFIATRTTDDKELTIITLE